MKNTGITVDFRNEKLTLYISRYNSEFRNPALILNTELGEPYCKASVNPNMILPVRWVAIKNWSENEGVMEALIAAGAIRKHGHILDMGYAHAHICVISDPIWDLLFETAR